jgi:hypothetical protein
MPMRLPMRLLKGEAVILEPEFRSPKNPGNFPKQNLKGSAARNDGGNK